MLGPLYTHPIIEVHSSHAQTDIEVIMTDTGWYYDFIWCQLLA